MFKSRELAKQAQLEYEQARGTAHKRLLQGARASLDAQITQLNKQIAPLQAELTKAIRDRDAALREDLSGHLVREHLMEVPGIGPRRYAAIIRLFRGNLGDLCTVHDQVDGIGEQTQQELNKWVAKYEQQIPRLLQQSFPGKKGINSVYEAKEKEINAEVSRLTRQNNELQKTKKLVDDELLWLEKINSGDFKQALQGASIAYPEIDRYIKGVFSEWEQMPGWFRKALTISGQQAPAPRPATGTASGRKFDVSDRTPVARRASVAAAAKTVLGSAGNSSGERIKSLPVWSWPVLAILFLGCFCGGILTIIPDIETTPTLTISPTPMATATAAPTRTPTVTSTVTPTTTPSPTPTLTPSPTQTPWPSATLSPTPIPLFVSNPTNLRSGPGTEFAVVEVIQPGDPLTLLDINDEQTWYRVVLADGLEGWVGSSVLAAVEE